MQYSETGLPQDPTVYKAFMMYSKNLALPRRNPFRDDEREAEGAAEMPLRLAQIMNESGLKDPQVLAFALLRQMPVQTYGLIEKSFGTEMTDAIREYAKHDKTHFAYIADASDKVKLMSMATAMATFEQFRTESERTQNTITKLSEGEKVPGGITVPFLPDTRIYDKLSDALYEKTSSPELESSFREKLSEFRYGADRLRGMILESGLAEQLPKEMLIKFQQSQMGERTPSFGETMLLDDPKVRAAFDLLVSHPMVSAQGIEAAIAVGELLTQHQTGLNSTAVAAGLLLTGLRDVNDNDIPFLKKKLDWDVVELLQNYGGEKDLYPHELRAAPPEFRQFLLANTVATLDRMKKSIPQLKEMIEQQPDIPEPMRPVVMGQQLEQLTFMAERMEGMMDVLGRTGAPHLEEVFHKNLAELRVMISENMPKVPKALPPPGFGLRRPQPPKNPGNGGQNFDLD